MFEAHAVEGERASLHGLRLHHLDKQRFPGQRPELALAENGSVQVISMNDSIGRDRWELTLTIAYRQDAYRVAGFTFRWRDTIENDNNGVCDLNLLTGRGLLSRNGGPETPIRTTQAPLPVTAWKDDMGPPPACGLPN